jgi:simple sugar transport system permease protein
LAFSPELGIIALGMTLLIISGEFDLSVGSVFALSPVLTAILVQHGGLDLSVALMGGILAATLVGLVNAWFVIGFGISSFLVTLATLMIVRGTCLYVTEGFPLAAWEVEHPAYGVLAGSAMAGGVTVYVSLLWFVALALLAGYFLNVAKIGNWIKAIGSNGMAATARGVPVTRVKVFLFCLTSTLAGLAGLISAFRIRTASPIAGTGYELEVIAMVVVGGTALTGGRGYILGTVMGVIILRMIRNGITMVGVPGLAYNIFLGAIILGMLVLHSRILRLSGDRR